MWPLDLSSLGPLNPVNEYLVNFSWFTAYETVCLGLRENVGSTTIRFTGMLALFASFLTVGDRFPLPYLRSLMQSFL